MNSNSCLYRLSSPDSPICLDGTDSQTSGSQKSVTLDADDETSGTVSTGEAPTSEPSPAGDTSVAKQHDFAPDLEIEDREVWNALVLSARLCSMIPLGQDRVYR